MNAQLQLHPVPGIKERPTYDNTYLGYESDWIAANLADLTLWWDACCIEVGEWDTVEFPSFCRSQHDIELARRDEYRNTLRQYE